MIYLLLSSSGDSQALHIEDFPHLGAICSYHSAYSLPRIVINSCAVCLLLVKTCSFDHM